MSTFDPVWYAWTGNATSTTTATTTGVTASIGSTLVLPEMTYTAFDPAWRGWWERQVERASLIANAAVPNEPAVRAVLQQRERNYQAAAKAAAERAERLLLKCLTPEERHAWEKYQFFDLVGSDGEIYRIHRGTHGNVRRMAVGPGGILQSVARLCCQPNGVPAADANLAQALWLKHDAAGFLKKTNVSDRRVINETLWQRALAVGQPREQLFFNAQRPA